MDLDAIAAFVAVAESGYFHQAATDLFITQQAVSKRIAGLEKWLGLRLFTRAARTVQLTIDGQVFLPHARNLLQAEQRAADSILPGHRALRVDVINPRIAPAHLLHDFHRAYPETALDVVTNLLDVNAAIAAIRSGQIDASFRAVTVPMRELPEGIESGRVFDEPLQLLVGPGHKLAAARAITPGELVGHRIWMPSNLPGTEWTRYYDDLAAAFKFSIDTIGPNFGSDALLDTIAHSPTLAMLVGKRTRFVWPIDYDMRRIDLHHPTPVYPHSLIWRGENSHPALVQLRNYLISLQPNRSGSRTWTPEWARHQTFLKQPTRGA